MDALRPYTYPCQAHVGTACRAAAAPHSDARVITKWAFRTSFHIPPGPQSHVNPEMSGKIFASI